MSNHSSRNSSSSSATAGRPIDYATITGDPEDVNSSGNTAGADAAAEPDEAAAGSCDGSSDRGTCGTCACPARGPRNRSDRRRPLPTGVRRFRRHWVSDTQHFRRRRGNRASASASASASSGADSPCAGTASQSNNQLMATSESSDDQLHATSPVSKDAPTTNSNDTNQEASPIVQNDSFQASDEDAEGHIKVQRSSAAEDGPFANLDSSGQVTPSKVDGEVTPPKSDLANVIEKAILDFCSSRTVETMRRMFAGVTSEMEALQGEAARQGDKSVQAPHPVTAELVKEGVVIGNMDVFAPRVRREFRLEMKDSLVEGFLKDVGVFRSICYRTKCQMEVTRRLLNRKLCSGGRWVKYLIVRIVGPSLRAIGCCDQLLQRAVPAFKQRIDYPKAAYCRLFFREDIPDNTMLYSCYQRTGGTAGRYGALRLETPYRVTTDRTVGSCPWKSGALRVGKLSFSGSGAHLSMQQVYPGYGYAKATPVEPACKGVEAVHRIETMHNQFLTRRQALLQDRRVMTIPVCR